MICDLRHQKAFAKFWGSDKKIRPTMQQTIESIRTLAASNMKPIQISERLHLPVDLVLQYSSK